MIKSITAWMIITIVGAVGVLGFITFSGSSTPDTPPSSVTPSASPGAITTAHAALAALRDAEARAIAHALDAAAQAPAVRSWYAPQSTLGAGPVVLRPDQPPRSSSTNTTPERASLSGPAQQALTQAASDLSGVVVLWDGAAEADASLVASAAGSPDEALTAGLIELAKAKSEGESSDFSGVWTGTGGLYEVHGHRLTSKLWGLHAQPLDAPRLDAYRTALGQAGVVLAQDKKAVVASIPEGASAPELSSIDLTQTALLADAGLGVIALPALAGSPAALVVATSAGPAPAAAAQTPAEEGATVAADPLARLQDLPNHPVPLAITGVSVIFIGLLFGFITRREARGYATDATALTHASDLEDDDERIPRSELESLQAQHAASQKQLEDLESSSRQIQSQLDYAREELEKQDGKLSEIQARHAEASQEVEKLRAQLIEARSRTSVSDVVPAADASSDATQISSRPDFLKPSKDGAPEEYDTAEVSGEEMSQLLDGIDKDESELGGLADQLEGMSEREASQLAASDPIILPGRGEEAPSSDEIDSEFLAMVESFGDELDSMLGDDEFTADQPAVSATNASPSGAGLLEGLDPTGTSPGIPRVDPGDADVDRHDTLADAKPSGTLPGIRRDTFDNLRKNSTSPGLPVFKKDRAEENKPTAPPPWKSAAKRTTGDTGGKGGLSPASLLEALKRRGQSTTSDTLPSEKPVDETKISPVTRELLEKSKRKAPRTVSRSGLFSRTGSKVGAEPSSDTEYFKSLYEEFLATKEKCGESTENITLERFVNRLARNKQALMDRYDCRTVRFQVYVKEGRAALKATPVK